MTDTGCPHHHTATSTWSQDKNRKPRDNINKHRMWCCPVRLAFQSRRGIDPCHWIRTCELKGLLNRAIASVFESATSIVQLHPCLIVAIWIQEAVPGPRAMHGHVQHHVQPLLESPLLQARCSEQGVLDGRSKATHRIADQRWTLVWHTHTL